MTNTNRTYFEWDNRGNFPIFIRGLKIDVYYVLSDVQSGQTRRVE